MLIIGAGGIASQMFDDLIIEKNEDILFWSEDKCKFKCIRDHFTVLHTDQDVTKYFETSSKLYVVGIWDIMQRRRLIEVFKKMGGELTSYVSSFTKLSSYSKIGNGSIVLYDTSCEPDVVIGENCIINKKVNFGHGAIVSSFCSVGPFVIVGSNTTIGEDCYIGMSAVIQQKVTIGKNVTIGVGSIVTKDIPENAIVSGSRAKVLGFKKSQR